MGIREDWRADRARHVWFLLHIAAIGVLVLVTDFAGTVFLIGGSVIAASYGVGYVVLTRRALRRARIDAQSRSPYSLP